MDNLNINHILSRDEISNQVKQILIDFEKNKHNLLFKRGIYIYGDTGSGKTTFVTNILKDLDYDIIKYDAGDIRNKTVIDDITERNMSDRNILSLFNKKSKKIAIIMDEIDGMNNGDKGGINTLIKLIRPKKTKKQKLEEITMIPIICIGNYRVDKKIKELIKVCNTIELKTPTSPQVHSLISNLLPNIDKFSANKMHDFAQYDLRKLNVIYNMYNKNNLLFSNDVIDDIFKFKSYNDDTKNIVHKLLNNYVKFDEHIQIMNENDRTSVGLLWHENIIDTLYKIDKSKAIPFYIKQLDNICFADYIDRITFQNQIWQFNELSSLIKTLKNNKLYHEFKNSEFYKPNLNNNIKPADIRFTKVLTKYSTEYNNYLFIQDLCHQLGMDKRDLFGFFYGIKDKFEDNLIGTLFDNYEIKQLDINRIYRYLDKYITEDAVGLKYPENNIDTDEEII